MPTFVCGMTALESGTECSMGGGIQSVKIIPLSDIIVTTMNAAPATYIDPATLKIKAIAFPLVAGKFWKEMSFDSRSNPARLAKYDDNINQASIEIGQLRFMGTFDTATIAKMRKCCNWVVATLFNSGTIKVDGIEYNEASDQFYRYAKSGGLAMKTHEETSGTGENEIGENTSFFIRGTTLHNGYTTLQTWATMFPTV
jgi:hypothetical protein